MKKFGKILIATIIITLVFGTNTFAGGINMTIEVLINSINLKINGEKVNADTIVYNRTTYVPLRVAAEMLGKEVDWDQATQTANIIDKDKEVALSEYDTKTLRNNANFRVKVADGVNWVPANVLGKSDLTAKQIQDLGNDPVTLKNNINILYEVIQYLQVADFSSADDNIRIRENGIDWEHHKPGEMAIKTNEGCCATNSNLLNYLLQGDYEEVGFMAYSQSDGSGHVYNYIKDRGKYYLIDLTHYRNDFMNTAVEDGRIEGYKRTDFIAGNIHEADNLLNYANYCIARFNNPPVVFSAYLAPNVLPIDSLRIKDQIEIVYPDSWKDKVEIVYDNPNDNMRYGFVAPPEKYPIEWEPYNTRY
ncbi:MAG: hypothetical protein K0S47_4370 [Herbinix sp.]|jgi:hypothetical protein|nr:hypothetical protein [Herbinix sp.]